MADGDFWAWLLAGMVGAVLGTSAVYVVAALCGYGWVDVRRLRQRNHETAERIAALERRLGRTERRIDRGVVVGKWE